MVLSNGTFKEIRLLILRWPQPNYSLLI
jgi:hypothetical protein